MGQYHCRETRQRLSTADFDLECQADVEGDGMGLFQQAPGWHIFGQESPPQVFKPPGNGGAIEGVCVVCGTVRAADLPHCEACRSLHSRPFDRHLALMALDAAYHVQRELSAQTFAGVYGGERPLTTVPMHSPTAPDDWIRLQTKSHEESAKPECNAPIPSKPTRTKCPPEYAKSVERDLNDVERRILAAALKLDATSEQKRATREQLSRFADLNPTVGATANAFSYLRKKGYLQSNKRGPKGGTWITEKGRQATTIADFQARAGKRTEG